MLPLTAMVVSSCSQPEPDVRPSQNGQTRITFSITPETRAVTDEDFKTSFTAGDRAGVFVVRRMAGTEAGLQPSGNYFHNLKLTYTGEWWATDEPVYFPNTTDEFDFYAYYPYIEDDEINPANIDFTVLTDQNSLRSGVSNFGYSDMMTAEPVTGIVPGNKDWIEIPFTFEHLLSLVQVRVMPESGAIFDESFTVTLKNVLPSTSLDLTAENGEELRATSGDPVDIIMSKVDTEPGNNIYRAVIPTQTLRAGELFVFAQTDPENTFEVAYTAETDTPLTRASVKKFAITLNGIHGNALRFYKIGDYYPDPDVDLGNADEKAKIEGIVFWLDPDFMHEDGESGSVGRYVSLQENDTKHNSYDYGTKWGPQEDPLTAREIGMYDWYDGRVNWNTFAAWIKNNSSAWIIYPAMDWILTEMNGGDENGKWYLPSTSELQWLYCTICGYETYTWDAGTGDLPGDSPAPPNNEETKAKRAEFNQKLTQAGGKPLYTTFDARDIYWSSSEVPGVAGYVVRVGMSNGYTMMAKKYDETNRLRPVAAFK